jgi:hypothetical protein
MFMGPSEKITKGHSVSKYHTTIDSWTAVLMTAGLVSLGATLNADETQHQVLTALSSTTLSGYVDTSAIWKFGTGDNLVGRAYDGTAKQDGFNLNVVQLSLAKLLDETPWSAGYQVDLLYGPDASTYRGMLGAAGEDLAIEQAHLKLKIPVGNGIIGTLGVFSTPFGYELFDSYKNPNYSRSYGYTIVPRQHTGLVLAYPFADWIMVAAGVANTCNSPINERAFRLVNGVALPAAESEKTYVGAVYLTAPESWGALKGATLNFVAGNGLNGQATATPSHATAYYVGGNIPTPLPGLSVGVAYDYISWEGFYANATALYFMYQATEKLKLNNRLEYASGTAGTWTGIVRPEGDKFLGETITVDYALWANVISRVEFRWDRYLGARDGAAAPFGMDDKNALSLALNLIYRF